METIHTHMLILQNGLQTNKTSSELAVKHGFHSSCKLLHGKYDSSVHYSSATRALAVALLNSTSTEKNAVRRLGVCLLTPRIKNVKKTDCF